MTDELDPQRLRALLDAAARLPKTIDPPADAWQAIGDRITAARPVNVGTPVAPAAARWSRSMPWRLAAAAAVLIAVSSGATALLWRGRDSHPAAVAATSTFDHEAAPPAETPVAPPPSRPDTRPARENERPSARAPRPASGVAATNVRRADAARVFAAFDVYQRAADDLGQAVRDRRSQLDPKSLAVLDTCLRKIDEAIADARAALARNPENALVNRLLTTSYTQKIDLLKRAAELPLRTL
jgi:hypothetical protein